MEVKPGYKLTEVGVIPEDWEVSKIGMVADLLTGFPFPSIGYANSGVRLLRGSNVKRGIIDWSDDLTKYWCGATQSLEKYELREHDVVIAMDGALVGKSYAQVSNYDIPSFLLQRVARLRSTDVSVDIILCWISSSIFWSYVDSVKTHTAIPHISPKDILTFTIAYPMDIHEQTAIATALSDVDSLISSLDALVSKKKQIKQGAMQELLSGKRRLPGFSGEWEVKRLGELVDFAKGRGLPKSKVSIHGKRQCIHYGELFTLYPAVITYIISRTDSNDEFFTSSTHDVLMPTSDVTPNGLAKASCILHNKIILGGDILVIRPGSNLFGPFLAYLIRREKKQIMNLVTGTTVFHLYAADMKKFTLKLPPLPEQKAIAAILSDMDAEITTLESRRNKTKLLKQGMMQELLTGRIRLAIPINSQITSEISHH
jgi:type I restriction enzyme S subunit